jgi:hypothetical protein
VNPSVPLLNLVFSVSQLEIALEDDLASSDNKTLILCAQKLSAAVVKRVYDMNIEVTLQSLRLEDLYRKTEKCILVSEADSGVLTPCLKLCVLKIDNIRSRRFDGRGIDISCKLSKFAVQVDSFSLYRAEPYVTAAFTALNATDAPESPEQQRMYEADLSLNFSPQTQASSSSNEEARFSPTRRGEAWKAKTNALELFNLMCSVEQVTFKLCNAKLKRNRVNDREFFDLDYLQGLFIVSISNLSFQMEKKDATFMTLKIRSLDLIDNRIVTQVISMS